MRSLLIFLQVVLLSAVIQYPEVFKKEKVKIGKKTCLCDFRIKIYSDKCSGSAKCDKKYSGTGTVELGGYSLTLRVNKGKGKIFKCFCKAATIPGSGSGETPVPMIGSGETPVPMTGSGETPVPMTGSGETPVPIPGSGCPPPVGGEGMQCSCNCNCPDGSGECDCKALTCAPGFSKVCPMMGGMCPQEMDPICPYNAMSRMVGNNNDYAWGKDKGCQCLPDFLLAMVMIQPTSRIETGSGSGNGEFEVGGIGSRCACVSKLIFGCDGDWTKFGSNCYKYYGESMTWFDAQARCEKEGSNLASVQTVEEKQFMVTLGSSGNYTWIGGNDIDTEGSWVWIDGSAWNYTNWGSGEPNNCCGGEHCVEMRGTMDNGIWNDQDCNDRRPFICKKI